MTSPRWSFARKLIVALLVVVAVQTTVLGLIVRIQTEREVAGAAQRALREARNAFEGFELSRWDELTRFAVFTGEGPRGEARFRQALQSRRNPEELAFFAADAAYQAEFLNLDVADMLFAYHDEQGFSILAWSGREQGLVEGDDPFGLMNHFDRAWEHEAGEARGYEVLGDRVYRVRTSLLIDAFGRELGAISVGKRVTPEDVESVSRVVDAPLCFVVEGACLVGTATSIPVSQARAEAEGARRLDVHTLSDGRRFAMVAHPIPESDDVSLALAVPLDPVLEPFERITWVLIVAGLGSFVLAGAITGVLARTLTRPLRALTEATERVGRGDYDVGVKVDTTDELGVLARSFNEMTEGLRTKERLRGVLNKVVAPEVAEELMGRALELGGETRQVTVLFGDLRGFTALTEALPPQRTIELLNECMGELSAAVDAEGGVVDKFVGDEIMALFGAPISRGDEPLRAVCAAVRMQHAIDTLNVRRARDGKARLGLGVGIATGEAVVGNMGAPNRLNYTALGRTVNLASRLCSEAEPGEILVPHSTLQGAGGASELDVESLGARALKGFSEAVEVFHVKSLRRPGPEPTEALSQER